MFQAGQRPVTIAWMQVSLCVVQFFSPVFILRCSSVSCARCYAPHGRVWPGDQLETVAPPGEATRNAPRTVVVCFVWWGQPNMGRKQLFVGFKMSAVAILCVRWKKKQRKMRPSCKIQAQMEKHTGKNKMGFKRRRRSRPKEIQAPSRREAVYSGKNFKDARLSSWCHVLLTTWVELHNVATNRISTNSLQWPLKILPRAVCDWPFVRCSWFPKGSQRAGYSQTALRYLACNNFV